MWTFSHHDQIWLSLTPTKYTLAPTTQNIMAKQARTLQSILRKGKIWDVAGSNLQEFWNPWINFLTYSYLAVRNILWLLPDFALWDESLSLLFSVALFTSFTDFALCYHSWPHLKFKLGKFAFWVSFSACFLSMAWSFLAVGSHSLFYSRWWFFWQHNSLNNLPS